MEVKMGTTPNGREIKFDLEKEAFIGQPVGDSIWLERDSLRQLLAECGWGVEEISWNGCPPGGPRDPKAEAEADAEASRLYDEARREFAADWAMACEIAKSGDYDAEEAADEFEGHIQEFWGSFPLDPVVRDKLRGHIVSGLS